MALDRRTVDQISARHIREQEQGGYVSPEQKRAIRLQHERAARKAEQKRR